MRLFLVASLLALTACTACTHGKPAPSPSPGSARARLHDLATAAANNPYDATYRFTARATAESGTIRLRQIPPQYRLDIKLGRTASYFALRSGIVSCTQRKNHTDFSCFLVARPGEKVPELFDPGVQRLFRDAVNELAKNPDDYAVTVVAPVPAPSGLPAGECFHVERTATPSPGFETGDYCFAADGLPTRYDVATGTLELTAVGPAPDAATFKPPAKPAVLPTLK